jgi:hypothetical protein
VSELLLHQKDPLKQRGSMLSSKIWSREGSLMFPILSTHAAGYDPKKTRVTCLTCKLKKCVGKCRFEAVACPRITKVA